MKRFQQLEIHKDHQSLIALLDRMKTAQNAVFFYDQEMSDMVNKNTKGDPICAEFVYYVFRTNDDGLYRAQVFLSLLNTELKVINITSSNPARSELGITRYNIILHCFFHNFIAHFIDASYTDCIFLTGENMSLRDYLGTDVYNALERWATTCNRNSPTADYHDEQEWFAFISLLHDSGKTLHPSDFSQWLSEDMQWPTYYNDVISDLSIKLEYSQSLLDYYNGKRNTQ